MIDHDRLFKELLTTFFWEFIELFFPAVTTYLERDSITFLDKELFSDVTSGERREVDLVAQAKFRGQETFFLIHCEHQSHPAADFGRRMFHYFARLYEKYALPVYPIVLFSYNTPQRSEPTSHQVIFPDKTILEFNYSVIQLNRLHWREYLRQENPIAAALMAKMQIQPQDRPTVKLECLRLLATLRLDPARMQLISGFIDTYLRLNAQEEQLFQTQLSTLELFQQEEVMEIVTSWMERGIEQGRQEGRQEGKQEGKQEEARSLILRLLNRRIGSVDSQLQAQIRSLLLSQLEELGEALLDFTDASDLQTWLEQHSSSN
ncbi:DUF4351 domain-containing protein [Gloeocapsopsis dulcis]|uniref:Flagellar assembly protein H n=1 Tax=Gloeocapsopsis dulcis AAB1 = 1H9 TaxID=1433147 RepID=A0A6N8FY76_9CHRO|nr:DUF4351 domain-containing protein [Gloeocapsopsis dulcis]MUL37285.1 flagellar assembly protein H [Gloeocapsopsis dulcis AAB1 = 1H9]WNN91089.1 DUF4351 domain-containing protein [Gloeocapsopsis dulcis]